MVRKFKVLILLVFILNCLFCFSQETQDCTANKLVVEFNNITPARDNGTNFWEKYFLPQTASIIALAVFILGWFHFYKQIKETRTNLYTQIEATEKNILKQYNLERISLLLENISNLMLEIKKDNGNFSQGNYISDEHFLFEKRILLLLDPNNDKETELSKYLLELTNNTINTDTIQMAVNKIEIMSNNIINNKIKE